MCNAALSFSFLSTKQKNSSTRVLDGSLYQASPYAYTC